LIVDERTMLTLAERFLAAWTSQDVERVLDCYTEDLVYLDPNTRGPVRGRDAMRRYLTRLFAAWTMTWSLREAALFEGGRGCTVLWHATLQRAGGPKAEADGMDLVEVREDRICRNEVRFDRSMLSGGLDTEALKQLLVRGWMTHDAMWFKNAIERVGADEANELNLAAIRDMAPIEVRWMQKALRLDGVASLAELEAFVSGAMALLAGDFMQFRWRWQPPDSLHVEVDRCFAFEGVRRIGAIEAYQCGIFERIYAWFDALGIKYRVTPASRHCTLHHDGTCVRDVYFSFAGTGP
jgi:ketosteroid isomerase-like protein